MKVFIAGGTGFVGGHLRQALLERGHQIRLLSHRSGGKTEAGVEVVPGDVTNLNSFRDAVSGCDATINLVGIIREEPKRDITFERLHVQATINVLSAAKHAGVKRHLQMSALGTQADSSAAYFRTKYLAEREVRRSGLDFTIFRPSIVYGPDDMFVNMLAKLIRILPVMPVIGDGTYQLQPISVDDVVRCFAEALEKPETIGETYELCGPDRLTYNTLLDSIAHVMKHGKVRKMHSPLRLMQKVVPIIEHLPFAPITSDQLTMLVQGNTCDGSWRKTFQFEPTGFEEGISKYLKKHS